MFFLPPPSPLSLYEQLALWAVLLVSELLAFFVIRQAWRSPRSRLEKCVLTALAVVPVLGLFFAWWIQNDPGPAPPAFRDHKTSDAEVFRRWLPVFKQRRGAKQARELAALVRRTKDEE